MGVTTELKGIPRKLRKIVVRATEMGMSPMDSCVLDAAESVSYRLVKQTYPNTGAGTQATVTAVVGNNAVTAHLTVNYDGTVRFQNLKDMAIIETGVFEHAAYVVCVYAPDEHGDIHKHMAGATKYRTEFIGLDSDQIRYATLTDPETGKLFPSEEGTVFVGITGTRIKENRPLRSLKPSNVEDLWEVLGMENEK